MHPATATTPFTLLWALSDNNDERPPPLHSFATSPYARAQQPRSAPMPTPLDKVTSHRKPTTRDAARPANAQVQSMTSPARNEYDDVVLAASDFLITNLRPDLLD